MRTPKIHRYKENHILTDLTPKKAAVYGQCIVADYNAVHKDKCAAEFARLKDCYLVGLPIFFPICHLPSSTSRMCVCVWPLLTHPALRKTESLQEDPVMA